VLVGPIVDNPGRPLGTELAACAADRGDWREPVTVGGELAPRVNRARRVTLTATSAAGLASSALAVLAAVPAWWARRAADYGIDADTASVWDSVDAAPPFDPSVLTHVAERDDLREATPEALGNAYVCALDAKARAETGRH